MATLLAAAPILEVPKTYDGPKPVHYGIVLFPAFEVLDVFGPLSVLNFLSISQPIDLSIIAADLSPVITRLPFNAISSNFFESVNPTHTFDSPPEKLDVLIVPGGPGTRATNLQPLRDYITATYPELQYLVTICTGSAVVAQTGILDGKKATSNKAAWGWVTSQGPKVYWKGHARWVVDGNIWTSSGVAAGLDATFAFVKYLYGDEIATNIANTLEYERHQDPSWDPFADIWNATDRDPKEN
ncbi:hypothetical protein RUND412_010002 [Rhizina undulata]